MGASNGNKSSIINPINLKEKVNSVYIIEVILSYLNSKRKLNIIKYNNNYQRILNIKLSDYKKISGKIIYGERTGYGKNIF